MLIVFTSASKLFTMVSIQFNKASIEKNNNKGIYFPIWLITV